MTAGGGFGAPKPSTVYTICQLGNLVNVVVLVVASDITLLSPPLFKLEARFLAAALKDDVTGKFPPKNCLKGLSDAPRVILGLVDGGVLPVFKDSDGLTVVLVDGLVLIASSAISSAP